MHRFLRNIEEPLTRLAKQVYGKQIKVKDMNVETRVAIVKLDYKPGYEVYFFDKEERNDAPF